MRLIDADRLKSKITGITKPHEFVEEIDKRPTVEALPIEWIKNKKIEYEHDRYDYVRGCFDGFNDCIDYLITEWEKENETSRCR